MISDSFASTEYLLTYREQLRQWRRKRGRVRRLEKLPLTGRASYENKILEILKIKKGKKAPLQIPMASKREEGPPR